jgi:ribosomal protein S18 acetylase RimI-like enzyme
MSVFIRSATERDLLQVQALLRRAWHAAYDAIHGDAKIEMMTQDWHSLANLTANLVRPWSEFLVADTGDALFGMAYARQSSEDFVMVAQLYVDPAHTGQGIGAQLIDECVQAFPQAKAFRLEVDAQNSGAVRFYQRYGFKEISRIEDCRQDGSNMPAIVMERR